MSHLTIIENQERSHDPAVVYLESDLLDDSTRKQIESMITQSSLSHSRIMPDCHMGYACCIGFTSIVSHTMVVPSYVGGDIGCGILTYPLNKTKLNLKRVESLIKRIVPMGNGHHNVHRTAPVEHSFIERYLSKVQTEVDLFCAGKVVAPIVNLEYLTSLCEKINMNIDICFNNFGTLGGGNHFIEINQDSGTSEYFLTIHSGSRAFGMKLFEHYDRLASKGVRHLDPENSVNYCIDMILAQKLAVMNRHIMLQLILREIDVEFIEARILESTHNYIDFKHMVLRKGAISAQKGEICIVSLNMRDGILICEGKGNEDWNCSCAHGCGRHMSRSEARRKIKMKDYKLAMNGVVTTSVVESTLDEAPQAYKDMNLIVSALEPTVTILKHLHSVVNLKGTD
jgi:tRNA-splicing ligase RtcB (3'-phosphate/5'-hydroxy nucleic acid ligase)